MVYMIEYCEVFTHTLGLGDVYQIDIGRCLQWNIVMDDDIGGWGKGVSKREKTITHSTEPLKQRFSIPVLVYLRISTYFSCLSLLTHQRVRSELCAWTVFQLTWSVVDKCNLEQILCLLKLLHVPYTVYSLSRRNLFKFTSLQNIHSRICTPQHLHTHRQNLLEKCEVWHNIPL